MYKSQVNIGFEELYNNLPCGCITVSTDEKLIDVNETFLKITGYDRDEVIDKMKFTDFLTAGSKIYLETHVRPMLHLYRQAEEIKIEILHKKRRKIPALLNSVQRRDHQGANMYVQHAILDISQRSLYEKELLSAKKDAEELNHKLSKANKELNLFATSVAHDNQSPLYNVIGLVAMLKQTYSTQLDHRATQFIEYIEKSSLRMHHHIIDLLKLSLNGRSIEDMELVDLNETVKLAENNLSNLIIETATTVVIPHHLPRILGFAPDLLSLFQNLIRNSIQFRKPDTDPVIEINFSDGGTFYLFKIKDNGIGIEPMHHSQIFKEYFTLESNGSEGLGLGLSKCKSIVENHKGSIGVHSIPSEGCTISFKLEK
jgi:PAS domain S-box-containing protein